MTNTNNVVDELFAVGAHFGYSKSKRHPSTKNLILGSKDGLDIINLEKTVESIAKAKERLTEIFSKGEKIIFVGSKAIIKDLTSELAENENILYVDNRWIGGTISNFPEIKKRIFKLRKLMEESENGEFSKYKKKEALQKEKEIVKLKKYYFGLVKLVELPKAIVVIDGKDEDIAVKEASDKKIDVISISSTDTDITKFNYPILANDRSRGTVEYIIRELFDIKK
ncbi:MAG: 30S ribosomal protein S2 [Candidatus Pacebacteria bacterium]|nr:30S ribosomal protein S2 [Candidatus Paceibacterota bacterium]